MRHLLVRRLVLLVAVSTTIVALLPSAASAESSEPTVMTRNLYLGADLAPAIAAPDVPSLLQAAAGIFQSVVATSFPERAVLLAQEIADTSPHLIGLQEVALWRTGALFDPAPATTVAFDFLDSLQAELASLGQTYTAAVVQTNFDGEVPATISSTGFPVFMDVRLTMRNVILVRSDVSYTNPQSVHFETNVTFPSIGGIPGNDLVDLRGWASVDATVGSGVRPFRFVNTHLEPFVEPVRDAQAHELVDALSSSTMKVVAVGDFNSPPTGPGSNAYHILTSPSSGKMRDAWVEANGDDPGFTFGQAADLLNPTSTASKRIDLVLFRTPAVKSLEAVVTGDTARTPSGLWASDHLGVVATLSVPPG